MGNQATRSGGTMTILTNISGNFTVYLVKFKVISMFFLSALIFASIDFIFPLFLGLTSVLSWGGLGIGKLISLCIPM